MRIVCMPVGPAGVRPMTVQLLCSLVAMRAVQGVSIAAGHLIPARNTAWAAAVQQGADSVLWLDADISAPVDKLIQFMSRADRDFVELPRLAWRGAVCMRRVPGRSMLAIDADEGTGMGIGLAYWHVRRVVDSMTLQGRATEHPFQWVPPVGEDYDFCRLLRRAGSTCDLDKSLPTSHDGVGDWAGDANG